MPALSDAQGFLGLVTRPEVLPVLLMVMCIGVLAVLSLRGSREAPKDDTKS